MRMTFALILSGIVIIAVILILIKNQRDLRDREKARRSP